MELAQIVLLLLLVAVEGVLLGYWLGVRRERHRTTRIVDLMGWSRLEERRAPGSVDWGKALQQSGPGRAGRIEPYPPAPPPSTPSN
jgi:hypothetical protein